MNRYKVHGVIEDEVVEASSYEANETFVTFYAERPRQGQEMFERIDAILSIPAYNVTRIENMTHLLPEEPAAAEPLSATNGDIFGCDDPENCSWHGRNYGSALDPMYRKSEIIEFLEILGDSAAEKTVDEPLFSLTWFTSPVVKSLAQLLAGGALDTYLEAKHAAASTPAA